VAEVHPAVGNLRLPSEADYCVADRSSVLTYEKYAPGDS